MKIRTSFIAAATVALSVSSLFAQTATDLSTQDNVQNSGDSSSDIIRFATFNVSLNRKNAGDLISELDAGNSHKARQLAEVIQRIRPHVILLNEIDYDRGGRSVELFRDKYLGVSQNGQPAIGYPHMFVGPVNTGIPSGLDLNNDGKTGTPNDAFGYGSFPGQYGMAVLSKFPIDQRKVRTFQKFLWKDMPGAMLPLDPDTEKPYYSEQVLTKFRLSSKSHWDVPIQTGDRTVHFICAHPTPPVFDGSEDRNGRRNHDEIRLIADYVGRRGQGNYIYDDDQWRGGLAESASFVIAGDMNADPSDGENTDNAAKLLTEHTRINSAPVPTSAGAIAAAKNSGRANDKHTGDPAADTGDFSDERVGNLRVDYVLPSKDLEVIDCGIFWPAPDDPKSSLNSASDHHLVWLDIKLAR